MNSGTITIGTRASKLALWQAEYIAGELEKHHPHCHVELKKMTTKGDRILDAPLAKIGGKGLFTKELEQAMLDGMIDLAVHSLKDMPTEVPEGLVIGAITERLDPGDAFVSVHYRTMEDLPNGARVGTSSLRRRAQLLAVRPDLKILDLRGNVNTRLAKLEAIAVVEVQHYLRVNPTQLLGISHSSLCHIQQHSSIGILAGTLRYLQYHRRFGFGRSFDDSLQLLHIVKIECGNGVTAINGFLKHFTGIDQP